MPRNSVFTSLLVLLVHSACSGSDDKSLADEQRDTLPFFTSVEGGGLPPDTSGPSSNMASAGQGSVPSGAASGSEGAPPVVGGVPPVDPQTAANGGAGGAGVQPPEAPVTQPPAEPGDGEPGDTTAVTPSAGCGNASPPTGQQSLTIRGAQADYLVTLPGNYSPDSPVPLIFGFHGRNRTFLQFQTVDATGIQQQLGSRAVMVYLESQGGTGWNNAMEVPPSVEFWEQLYPRVLETYCVDTSRVFAVGHSSGGIFSNILACRHGDLLRGVGVVAGDQQEQTCTGKVASILIHGPQDTVVSFSRGLSARSFALARNSCTESTRPAPVGPCVAYQGCEPGLPVTWCEHDEPTYLEMGQPTNHGWPSFATAAIADFLFSLP